MKIFVAAIKRKVILFLIILLAVNSVSLKPIRAQDNSEEEKASILDLQNQIQDKAGQIDEIQDKIAAYEKEVDNLQNKAATLKGHINILDSQINKTEDEVNLLNSEIQQKELEIKKLALDINLTQKEIDKKLEEIETILQEINSLDEDYLGSEEAESRGIIDIIIQFFKVIIKYNSWAEYEKTVEDTSTINDILKQKRDKLSDLQANLEADKKMTENKVAELTDRRKELENKQQVLAEEKTAKKEILSQTQENEEKYEALLEKAAAAQRALNQEVVTLKEEVRKKIATLQEGAQNLNAILTWPIPYRRITSTFHDPSYPYRRYFEHNAIDIACPQGTPIYAPAAGYVARTRDAGYGYNYITLIHTEKLQTRYGHVSAFAVQEGDFVKAGQIIGYTGATPGTPGAGYFTTGPHLHFEVHIGTDEIDSASGQTYTHWEATNPLQYLP
ncbi:MAG: peptidoglycan DD-metalloendopeptidase family protein [Patescibacteria group bacterium]|nr:peptidoglycan DD-metalloendopeptidase family protein [Patescibacteria group bacterium]